jgi:TRAP-type C4-dicarboxylate transport system substrate-binding protein
MNRNFQKALITLLMSMMMLSLCGISFSADAPKVIELTATYYGPPTDMWANDMKFWASELEKRTGGQVKVRQWSWAGSLLDAKSQVDGVGRGMADFTVIAPAYNPAYFPIIAGISVTPFVGEGYVTGYIVNELIDTFPPLLGELHRQNLEFLWVGCGYEAIIASVKKIKKYEDLQGLKIRGLGIWNDVLKRLGSIPVAMSTADVYMALQRGTLQGVTGIPVWYAHGTKYHEVVKQYLDPGFGVYTTFCPGVMNRDTYKKLPDSVKKAIKDLRVLMNEKSIKTTYDADKAACLEALKHGVELSILPPTEMKRWKDQVRPEELWDEWLGPKGRGRGLSESRQIFDLFRKGMEKWKGKIPATYANAFRDVVVKK